MIKSSMAALIYFNFLVFDTLFDLLIGEIGLSGRIILERDERLQCLSGDGVYDENLNDVCLWGD